MSGVKFADKFLIKSNRHQDWDYTTPANYFVTICTLNHNNFFGKIQNKKMVYSHMGLKCHNCLIQTEKHFTNVKISEWIIMPNHIHFIIKIINKNQSQINGKCRDVACYVSTSKNIISTPQKSGTYVSTSNNNSPLSPQQYFSNISPKPNSLPVIIRSFKSAVSKSINKKKHFFAWQPRFYDHIVQNKREYYAIQQYIRDNIGNWLIDPYHYK